MEHFTVYRKAGRFAGWPANYGIWSWGDEIVVAFTLGYMDLRGGFHKRDRSRPFTTMQARSLDGGQTWHVDEMCAVAPAGSALSAWEHQTADTAGVRPIDPVHDLLTVGEPIDFTDPNLAMMCARTGLHAGAISWFYVSADRCASWLGPYAFPDFGLPGIAARTDYIIDSPERCTFFLTAAKANGREGRVFCARTEDGGQSFRFLSWIGPEPEGHAIMPSTVRLPSAALLTAIRRKEGEDAAARYWIELYRSGDDGATWTMANPEVARTGGNPPSMIRLADGRLCITYGYRLPPYGIRARLSQDEGQSWGREVILRQDGGDADLGYPRTVQRADGQVVTCYYYNEQPGGERYIGATVWQP